MRLLAVVLLALVHFTGDARAQSVSASDLFGALEKTLTLDDVANIDEKKFHDLACEQFENPDPCLKEAAHVRQLHSQMKTRLREAKEAALSHREDAVKRLGEYVRALTVYKEVRDTFALKAGGVIPSEQPESPVEQHTER